MTSFTTEDYASVIAVRMAAERLTLSARWLARLREVLTVSANEVFPSEHLLDHIPLIVDQIARFLSAPEEEEIAANAAVMDKARELGLLRHEQRATAHQLLHEYEMLGEILEAFLVEETDRLGLQPSVAECFGIQRRLTRAVRVLMRTTVDTFIAEYTATIQEQHERIHAFNRTASHELRSPIGTLRFAGALLEHDAVRQDPQRLAKVAATVRTSADRLSWLVENLQRIAQMRDAVDVPSEQRVELTQLAAEVARQLSEMAAARGVTIRVAPDLPGLLGDPARIELVLHQPGRERGQIQRPAEARAVRGDRARAPDRRHRRLRGRRHVHHLRTRQRPRHPGGRSTGHLRPLLPRACAHGSGAGRHRHRPWTGDCGRLRRRTWRQHPLRISRGRGDILLHHAAVCGRIARYVPGLAALR